MGVGSRDVVQSIPFSFFSLCLFIAKRSTGMNERIDWDFKR